VEFGDVEEQARFILRWLPIVREALHRKMENDSMPEYPDAHAGVVDLLVEAELPIGGMPVLNHRGRELRSMVLRISLFPEGKKCNRSR